MKNFIFISPHFPENYWKFCLALKSHGYNVLGIGDAPYHEIPDQCKYALTEYYCCSFMDNFENERHAVQYFVSKYGHIDFLESNNEYWLEKDAILRKEFGITSGAMPEEVAFYRHKSKQKEIFKKARIKCARYTLSSTVEETKKFAELVGFPIFAKPDDGVGAADTYKMNDEHDIEVFYERKAPNQQYIIEEFVNGTIVSYDGITNSKAEVIFQASNIFPENVADIVNNNLDDMYYCVPEVDPKLEQKGRKVVKAFNVKNRFFHIEFFRLNEDHPYLGKKGTYIPLETNMRPAGAFTPDLIDYANSISVYEIYADSVTYDENRQVPGDKKYYAVSSSRRENVAYVHEHDEITGKYWNKITMDGKFPNALRSAMGDYYYMAKFDTLEECLEFDKFVREKKV